MSRVLVFAGIAHGYRVMRRSAKRGSDDLHDCKTGRWTDHRNRERTYFRIDPDPAPKKVRPVLVLHEVFGLSPGDLAFCRRLADAGFTVYAPVLLGEPGKAPDPLYQLKCLAHVCVSREFATLSWYRSSPITDSLRALGRDIYAAHGDPGFGVIGLCLTGNFALAMMADEHLVAPVLGEPALPFAWSKEGRAALGLSEDELACIKRRLASGDRIFARRFSEDRICPPERFAAYAAEFGSGFDGKSIASTPHGHHSVFADDYDPDVPSTANAFAELLTFLRERMP
jgi:dienelactone hydrolase